MIQKTWISRFYCAFCLLFFLQTGDLDTKNSDIIMKMLIDLNQKEVHLDTATPSDKHAARPLVLCC
jgi:hypothetical protein